MLCTLPRGNDGWTPRMAQQKDIHKSFEAVPHHTKEIPEFLYPLAEELKVIFHSLFILFLSSLTNVRAVC